MLPFLKNRDKQSGGIVHKYKSPDGGIKSEPTYSDGDDLRECASDLLKAVQSNDINAVAEAIRAAFTILDSQPHEEGPHTNESSDEQV